MATIITNHDTTGKRNIMWEIMGVARGQETLEDLLAGPFLKKPVVLTNDQEPGELTPVIKEKR